MADALAKMRAICKALPDVTEGTHFGDVMFRAKNKPFASCGTDGIVVGLEPEHIDVLVASDPAVFSRYPRAKYTLLIDTRKVKKWGPVKDLVLESYRSVTAGAGAKPAAKKSAAKKPAAKKPAAKR